MHDIIQAFRPTEALYEAMADYLQRIGKVARAAGGIDEEIKRIRANDYVLNQAAEALDQAKQAGTIGEKQIRQIGMETFIVDTYFSVLRAADPSARELFGLSGVTYTPIEDAALTSLHGINAESGKPIEYTAELSGNFAGFARMPRILKWALKRNDMIAAGIRMGEDNSFLESMVGRYNSEVLPVVNGFKSYMLANGNRLAYGQAPSLPG